MYVPRPRLLSAAEEILTIDPPSTRPSATLRLESASSSSPGRRGTSGLPEVPAHGGGCERGPHPAAPRNREPPDSHRHRARDRVDELVLAYACSIHKSQGSEYPCMVIPVHTQHYMMLQRNLLYTAITRGKRLVVLVGSKRERLRLESHGHRAIMGAMVAHPLRAGKLAREGEGRD